MAAPLRIRIVASVDASLTNVFNSMATAAQRAGRKIGANLGAGATIGTGPYRSMPAQVGTAFGKAQSSGLAFKGVMGSVADGVREKFDALSRDLHKLPNDLKTLSSVAQAELSKMERARARTALGLTKSGPGFWTKQRSMPSGMAWGIASRLGMGALHGAESLGFDFLRGIGVNTDTASMFERATQNQTLFRDISNFGYMPNTDTKNNQRIDPDVLLKEAHRIGQQTGFSATEVGEGLEKFVGLTGDLNLGRDAMKDMAVLSKATGSNLAEMVEAAGAASNTLGDVPNKAEVLYEVMKRVSSEGKTGAVLIKDLAKEMAKIAASAQMYSGNRAENIEVLGAIAQSARGRGGAASASQAATAVQAFTQVFQKAPRLRAFEGFGIKPYTATGGLQRADNIIVQSFEAAMRGGYRLTPGGKRIAMPGFGAAKSPERAWQSFEQNLTEMFGDVRSQKAFKGFETIFKDTFAGTKGTEEQRLAAATASVREEFHRLSVDMMDEKTVQEDFALAMANTKSQVAVFNDQIQETAEGLQRELAPAVVKLAPEMVLLAKGVASAIETLLGITPSKPVNPNDVGGAEAEKAGQEAIDLANKRFPGPYRPNKFSMFPDANAVPLPAGGVEKMTEHAAQLAGEVAAARGRYGAARGAMDKAYGLEGKSDAEVAAIMAEARKPNAMGEVTEYPLAEPYEKALKELNSAEHAQEIAKQVAEGVKQGLLSGRMSVVIEEDKTKKPAPGTRADQPSMPAESQ